MTDGFTKKWPTQLRKGVLELSILNALRGNRLYGYDLVSRLRELDGLVVGQGTVYPILSRLKAEGFLRTTLEESPAGPARKYYQLTAAGERTLDWMNESWRQLAQGIEQLQKGIEP